MEMSVCDSIIKPSCPPSFVHIHAKILVMQSSPLMKYVLYMYLETQNNQNYSEITICKPLIINTF